jgi:hypothetical protein
MVLPSSPPCSSSESATWRSVCFAPAKKWEVLPDSCSESRLQIRSLPHFLPEGLLFLGSAAKDKNKREEESISLLEEGFLPVLPVAVREAEREESMLDLLEAVVFLLAASSAAREEDEEEESELADLPCFDKGLGALFFFFSFLSLLALELLGILV